MSKNYRLLNKIYRMSKNLSGEIKIEQRELDLNLTLLGGQSFRWIKKEKLWCGVAKNIFWELQRTPTSLQYEAYLVPGQECNVDQIDTILREYLRLDFDLNAHLKKWISAHQHFENIANHCGAVRMLDQEPLENIISFICSQNNNIKRISSMVQWICKNYGEKIGCFNGEEEFTFPTLHALMQDEKELEQKLRSAKFGYRAKFIAGAVKTIHAKGGESWLNELKSKTYEEARNALVELPGIGYKVADCICLMSLNHLESIPVDTHIYQVACNYYMPQLKNNKSTNISRRLYEEIAQKFRDVYGDYAGWAQTVLFCSDLPQFKENVDTLKKSGKATAAKRMKK